MQVVLMAQIWSRTQGSWKLPSILQWLLACSPDAFRTKRRNIHQPGRRQRLPGMIRGHLLQISQNAATGQRGYHNTVPVHPNDAPWVRQLPPPPLVPLPLSCCIFRSYVTVRTDRTNQIMNFSVFFRVLSRVKNCIFFWSRHRQTESIGTSKLFCSYFHTSSFIFYSLQRVHFLFSFSG